MQVAGGSGRKIRRPSDDVVPMGERTGLQGRKGGNRDGISSGDEDEDEERDMGCERERERGRTERRTKTMVEGGESPGYDTTK